MSPLTARLGRFTSLTRPLRGFPGARGGNVSILFGLSLIPLIGIAGLGTDYGIAMSAKSKLDNAADTAALAAVATAKAYVANNQNDPNLAADAIQAGLDRATRAFKVNAGTVSLAQTPAPAITLTRSGQTFSSTVSYSTTTTTQFGKMFGTNNLTISGSVAATGQVPSYLDFYLLIDESGSMGLPSTADGQALLKSINHDNQAQVPEGCQFACHFPGYSGYNLALQRNIQLRSGAVNYAVCQLLISANATQVANQYRVGFYPFINQMAVLAPLTTNIASLQQTANCSSSNPMTFTSLLDTGTTQFYSNNNPSTGTGSGGTHFESALPTMQATVNPYGDGSSSTNSRPFVFIITDGMQNSQHYATTQNGTYYYPGNPSTFNGYSSGNFDGSSPQAITPSLCASLRAAGATISVLYIPYTPLVYTSDPWGEDYRTNQAIPNLKTALTSCANTGFFYTANTPADINNALQAMFNQAVQVAHLSR